jgi:hypothetical protein
MAPCLAGRVDALWVVFACWPIEGAGYGDPMGPVSRRQGGVHSWPAQDRDGGVRPLGMHRMALRLRSRAWRCPPQPCDEGFRCRRDQVGAANHTRGPQRLNAPQSERSGKFLLNAHRLGAPKTSLADSAKVGGDGFSTGIAARAIRRSTRRRLSRPLGRAATLDRDGSDRTTVSAGLNVSRETLSSGFGTTHSGLVAGHCDPAAFIHRSPSPVKRPIPRLRQGIHQSLESDAAIARLMRGRSRSRVAGSSPRPNRCARRSSGNCYPPTAHPGPRPVPGRGPSDGVPHKSGRLRVVGPQETGPTAVRRQRSVFAAERMRSVMRGGRRPGGWVPRRCCRFGRQRGRR